MRFQFFPIRGKMPDDHVALPVRAGALSIMLPSERPDRAVWRDCDASGNVTVGVNETGVSARVIQKKDTAQKAGRATFSASRDGGVAIRVKIYITYNGWLPPGTWSVF